MKRDPVIVVMSIGTALVLVGLSVILGVFLYKFAIDIWPQLDIAGKIIASAFGLIAVGFVCVGAVLPGPTYPRAPSPPPIPEWLIEKQKPEGKP